jgi:hypothetical protein
VVAPSATLSSEASRVERARAISTEDEPPDGRIVWKARLELRREQTTNRRSQFQGTSPPSDECFDALQDEQDALGDVLGREHLPLPDENFDEALAETKRAGDLAPRGRARIAGVVGPATGRALAVRAVVDPRRQRHGRDYTDVQLPSATSI